MFPPDHQRVNQVLEIGIELGDVASDGQDVGIQCTDLGSDLHDHCPGVDVGFVDECLEVSHANWAVPNVVVLVVDHGLCLCFWTWLDKCTA